MQGHIQAHSVQYNCNIIIFSYFWRCEIDTGGGGGGDAKRGALKVLTLVSEEVGRAEFNAATPTYATVAYCSVR